MIRIGVIGAGNHSRLHGEALAAIRKSNPDRVSLDSVCDLDGSKCETYRKTFGFETCYESTDRMLEVENLDLVLAITPVDRTRDIATTLLAEGGKPGATQTGNAREGFVLLVEKPPGLQPQETLDLVESASSTECVHMVSFNRRFSPALVRALDWIRTHELPPPFHVASAMVRSRRQEEEFAVGTGIHLIDALCSIMGKAVHVSTNRHMLEHTQGYSAYVEFAAGTSASVTIAPDSAVLEEHHTLYGDGYRIFVDIGRCACTFTPLGSESERVTWIAPDEETDRFRDGTLGEMRALISLAETRDDDSAPTLSVAYQSMVLAQAISDGHTGSIEY